MRRERRQKVHITPAGPQTFMSSSAHVAPRRPVRFHCIILSSVPASAVPVKRCLFGRMFSITVPSSINQSVNQSINQSDLEQFSLSDTCSITDGVYLCIVEV